MTRWSVVLILTLAVSGCSSIHRSTSEVVETGWLDRSVFAQPALSEFQAAYDSTQVSPDVIQLLREADSGLDMIVFLGTWCPDSKRQVPRFLKIIDLAGIPPTRVRLYGVDRSKKSQDGLTDQYSISLVPTFIFLRKGTEVGRIVEVPQTSMEMDMLSIFAATRQRQ